MSSIASAVSHPVGPTSFIGWLLADGCWLMVHTAALLAERRPNSADGTRTGPLSRTDFYHHPAALASPFHNTTRPPDCTAIVTTHCVPTATPHLPTPTDSPSALRLACTQHPSATRTPNPHTPPPAPRRLNHRNHQVGGPLHPQVFFRPSSSRTQDLGRRRRLQEAPITGLWQH